MNRNALASPLWALFAALLLAPSLAIASPPPGHDLVVKQQHIRAEIAAFRGLSIDHDIPSEFMPPEALRQVLLHKLAEEMSDQEIADEATVLQVLGLLDARIDYKSFMVDLLTSEIAGFYDDDTKSLFVVERPTEDFDQVVLVHELFHAIQDHLFGLESFRAGGKENADLMAARTAFIEGDAMAVMLDYEMPSGTSFTDIPGFARFIRASASQAMVMGGDIFQQAPLVLRESLLFPYIEGLVFLATLKEMGGWPAVDAVYSDPPMSTEQILHPERYLDRDHPTLIRFIAPATSTSKPFYDNVSGELAFLIYFKQHQSLLSQKPAIDAKGAATGWGGDRVHAYRDAEGNAFVVMLSTWDSLEDATEAFAATDEALNARFPAALRQRRHSNAGEAMQWTLKDRIYYLERRGTMVLTIEGLPASMPLTTWRESIWHSHTQEPYPAFTASVPQP